MVIIHTIHYLKYLKTRTTKDITTIVALTRMAFIYCYYRVQAHFTGLRPLILTICDKPKMPRHRHCHQANQPCNKLQMQKKGAVTVIHLKSLTTSTTSKGEKFLCRIKEVWDAGQKYYKTGE